MRFVLPRVPLRGRARSVSSSVPKRTDLPLFAPQNRPPPNRTRGHGIYSRTVSTSVRSQAGAAVLARGCVPKRVGHMSPRARKRAARKAGSSVPSRRPLRTSALICTWYTYDALSITTTIGRLHILGRRVRLVHVFPVFRPPVQTTYYSYY